MNSNTKKSKTRSTILIGYVSIIFMTPPVAQAESFVGNWGLRIPTTTYISTEKKMIDHNVKEETLYLVSGKGANGIGNMEIRGDGTYILRVDDLGNHWSTSGTWRENPGSRIGGETVNGITLINAQGKENQFGRDWFVYYKEDGRMQTAAPPYGIGYIYDLVGPNGKVNSIPPKKTKESTFESVGERSSSTNSTSTNQEPETSKSPEVPVIPETHSRTWTIEELKSQFYNQDEAHLLANMGEPNSTGYKSLKYRDLNVVDDTGKSVCTTVSFDLTESKGGVVWHLTCL